jgi:hypothetical protein
MPELDFTNIAESCREEGMILWLEAPSPVEGHERKRVNIEFIEEDGTIKFDVSTQGLPEFDEKYWTVRPVAMTEPELQDLLARIVAIHGEPTGKSLGDPMMAI